MYSSEQVTLRKYLNLPESVLNLRFNHYYFYDNTLVNLKNSVGYKNLRLNKFEPLSMQIKHEIMIPDGIIEFGNPLPLIEVIHEGVTIYSEQIEQVFNYYGSIVIPRAYSVRWYVKGALTTIYNQTLDYRFNTVNTKGDKIDTSNWHNV